MKLIRKIRTYITTWLNKLGKGISEQHFWNNIRRSFRERFDDFMFYSSFGDWCDDNNVRARLRLFKDTRIEEFNHIRASLKGYTKDLKASFAAYKARGWKRADGAERTKFQKLFDSLLWVRFGLVYAFFIYCFFLAYFRMPDSMLLSRDKFSAFVIFELGMFVIIFFCFLYFFGVIKKYKRPLHLVKELREVFISNLISIFVVYAALLFLNYICYANVTLMPRITRFFFIFAVNIHSQDYALLIMKVFYLLLGALSLYMAGKYFIRGKVSFQYISLVALAVWGGLFMMNFDNVFYALLVVDAVSLVTVAIVGLSAFADSTEALNFSLHYYLYSVFTSVMGYAGCFFLYTTLNTVNVNAILVLASTHSLNFAFNNLAFTLGMLLLLIKVMFLFGVYPFQFVVVEVSSRLNYGYLFFFLVVSKFPVYIFFIKLLKVLWCVDFNYLKYFILLTGLASLTYSTFFIAITGFVKQFLAYSSINQMGYVLIMLFFVDIAATYTSSLFFISYAVACSALYLFLAAIKNYTAGDESDGDIDTWSDLRRFLGDSYLLVKMRSRWLPDAFSKNTFFLLGMGAAFLAIITLGAFPFLSGFFLKLTFIEAFLHHGLNETLTLILASSLVTAYGYFNMLSLSNPELKRSDSNKFIYNIRVSDANSVDGVLFPLLAASMVGVTVLTANMKWFWWYVELTRPFFYDHFYYAYVAHVINDQSDGIKQGFILLFFATQYDKLVQIYNKIRNYAAQRTLWGHTKYFYKNVNFYKGSYQKEFIVVLTVCALIFMYGDAFWYSHTPSADRMVFWWRLVHYVLMNLFCWALIYNITYSVLMYRLFFALYLIVSFILPGAYMMCLWIHYYYLPYWVQAIWMGWLRFPANSFSAALYTVWDSAYFIFWGTALWALIITYSLSLRKGYHGVRFGSINYWPFNPFWHIRGPGLNYTFKNIIIASLFHFLADYLLPYRRALYIIFVAFFAFGPGIEYWIVVDHNFVFIAKSMFNAFVFWTGKGFLPFFFFWWYYGTVVYCWFMGITSRSGFLYHVDEMEAKLLERFRDPAKLYYFAIYVVLALIIPAFLATKTSLLLPTVVIYMKIIYYIQTIIYYGWHVSALLLLSYAIMQDKCGARHFVLTIYYMSISIIVFFFNQIIIYRTDPMHDYNGKFLLARQPASLEPFSFGNYDYFGIVQDLFFTLPEGHEIAAFSLACDYFSLVLCFMTALVFSFVFLISLFNENIGRKKVFFSLLLLIECLTILTFLSSNLLGFVIFFEASLLPMALIIGYWGSSYKRWFASKLFFFYSLISSLPATVATVHLYRVFNGDLDYGNLISKINLLTLGEQKFLWIALFLMFAVKIPLFPFHSWLLNAHVEAPTAGSIVLASVMLKLGAFGFIRYLLGLLPDISSEYGAYVCAAALISIFFSSVSSLTERDAKKLVAQTSISHMGLVVLGLFIFSEHGFFGAFYMIVGHAVTSTALFYLVGILYDRFRTRDLNLFGGLAQLMPLYCSGLFFFAVANAGFPWSLSFLGEMHILMGITRQLNLGVFLIVIVCSVILLYSNLRLFISISFGTTNKDLISNATNDLTHLELFAVLYLITTALALMWGNDYYFNLIYYDVMWRHFY